MSGITAELEILTGARWAAVVMYGCTVIRWAGFQTKFESTNT